MIFVLHQWLKISGFVRCYSWQKKTVSVALLLLDVLGALVHLTTSQYEAPLLAVGKGSAGAVGSDFLVCLVMGHCVLRLLSSVILILDN